MKSHPDGFNIVEIDDIINIIKKGKCSDCFVYDKEFESYDYITDIYVDDNNDLIIEIGGDS